MTHLIYSSNPIVLLIAVLLILFLAVELSYRWGQRSKGLTAIDRDSWNTVQAGLITLAAFMLGLTFAQAQGRWDNRRALVVTEANAIGTTWLRGDQLPAPETAQFRQILTQYTRERIQAYSIAGDSEVHARVISDSDRQQTQMWALVSQAVRDHPSFGTSLLMTSLNDTIDVSSEQLSALTHHVPTAVLVVTFSLVLLGAISIGLQFARDKSRPLLLTLLYAGAFAIVLNLIVDFDRPQVGFIHVSLDPLQIQLHSMEKSL
ncbi:MAG: hypothetical protein WA814_05360 [Candidatus Baltobacteraceae bacterium]